MGYFGDYTHSGGCAALAHTPPYPAPHACLPAVEVSERTLTRLYKLTLIGHKPHYTNRKHSHSIYINGLRASYCENRSHLAHKLAGNENECYPRQHISEQ